MYFHATQFETSSIGSQLIEVHCEQCSCKYFYEFTRVGTGTGVSVYGLANKGAADSSNKNAAKDLVKRLATEAELVPCPNCQWISKTLTVGYRRSRFKALSTLAMLVSVIGTSISLICAWCMWQGPAVDHKAIPYFLIYGPAFFILSAMAIKATQAWLRSRIHPNKNYPSPPTTPENTPTALIVDTTTGRLVPAASQNTNAEHAERKWLTLKINSQELPPYCCHCLGDVNPEMALQLSILPSASVIVPVCKTCIQQLWRRGWCFRVGTSMTVLLCTFLVLTVLQVNQDTFWVYLVAFGVIGGLGLGAFVGTKQSAPCGCAKVDADRGIAQLWFRNQEYAQRATTDLLDVVVPIEVN